MDASRKAEIKRAYKETASRRGIFKVHCAATGQTWVDASPNVDTMKNRVWFTLGMGTHPNRDLQRAWDEGGEAAMAYAVVEVFAADVTGYDLQRMMRERKQHWLEVLQAEPYL